MLCLLCMIKWPAIILYKGEDELTFISSEEEWKVDPDRHFHLYSVGDELIDVEGTVYQLPYDKENKVVIIKETNNKKTIKEFEMLIKKHLVVINECCVAKFQISSIREGMSIVERTEN